MKPATSTATLPQLKRGRKGGTWLPWKHAARNAERGRRTEVDEPAQERRAFDKSHAGHSLRYVSFVLGLGVTVSVTLFTPPVLLMARFGACERGCLFLDQELSRSLDHNVHPCDDFYEHVCSGWDNTKTRYLSPLDRYRAAFSRRIIKGMMLQEVPSRSATAKGKAAGFFFRCLSRGETNNVSAVIAFLDELGLPWPDKSPTDRQQLLDIFARASLQLGMPMFLAFYIGRHPSQASVSAVYMTLEPRFREWIGDIEALAERSKEDDYLRRCAEIVGREGQSYSSMIREVLQTHFELVHLARLFWGNNALPQFYNLSDPDLRRAINGHLPDGSQLWPEDEIVVLQPDFFAKLDAEHLSHSGFQESFKLFLGAYVVWALSPLVSRHLSTRMLLDVGGRYSEGNHRLSKCIQALEMVMPLVIWQLHRDAQKDLWPTWTITRLSARSIASFLHSYGDVPQALVSAILSKLGANAFNMTNTWVMLDNAMAYLSDNTDAPFFDLYRTAAKTTVTFFKQSLRRPQHNIHHVPGIASIDLYRLIVNREVSIFYFLTSAPLYEPWHPAAVISALAGTLASTQIVALLRIALYYDSRFQRYPLSDRPPEAERLVQDVHKFYLTFRASGIIPDATQQEESDVYKASIAVHAASGLQDMPEWRRFSSDGGRDSSLDGDPPNLFRSFDPEQLFFYLTCFAQCGKPGRQRRESIAMCNVALPASPRFRRAFKCLALHRLVTNFTWPELPAAPPTVPS